MDNLRPCIIIEYKFRREGRFVHEEENEKRGFFHRWEELSSIIEPSIMKGGHSGGVIKQCVAIVELEDGTVVRVEPNQIKFTDREQKGEACQE